MSGNDCFRPNLVQKTMTVNQCPECGMTGGSDLSQVPHTFACVNKNKKICDKQTGGRRKNRRGSRKNRKNRKNRKSRKSRSTRKR